MLVLLAAACVPAYNWRQLSPEDSGVRLMLPARPVSMSRRILLGSQTLDMTMHGARVDANAFTVAWVDLEQDDPAARASTLAAMREGMLRNIGATEHRERTIAVPRLDAGGQVVGSLEATEVRASGAGARSAMRLVAVFMAEGRRAWQMVAIGPALEADQVAMFKESIARLGTP